MDKQAIKVGVIGATGYAGVELCRLVLGHPFMELVYASDRKQPGTSLAEIYPALRELTDIVLSFPDADEIASCVDLAFLAVPHTVALSLVPRLLEAGVSVIDLSADYRLSNPQVYEAWYETAHTSPELLEQAVYGLPEINRAKLLALADVHAQGRPVLVAVPGCYPTATTLALAPALQAGIVSSDFVIANAISGVSGAGRTPSARTHFCHAYGSVEAYGVAQHRHTPEIEQTLTQLAGREMSVVFIPHLAPLSRGLLSTVSVEVCNTIDEVQLQTIYAEFYQHEALVSMLPLGTMPQTASVAGSARAQVGVALDARRRRTIIASCAIDNLGKGAATQAVQAANIVCGFSESSGLDFVAPVL